MSLMICFPRLFFIDQARHRLLQRGKTRSAGDFEIVMPEQRPDFVDSNTGLNA